MLTICVNSGQGMTNTKNNNFYCMCMYIIIRCFLLLNHTVYIQLQLYSSTVFKNCLTLILFMQHTITKSVLNTEIILPNYASIMLDAFRYPLCSKLCRHNMQGA